MQSPDGNIGAFCTSLRVPVIASEAKQSELRM